MDPLCQQRDRLVHALGGDESCMMPHPRQLSHQEDAEAVGKGFGSWACPRSSHGEVMWGEELLLVPKESILDFVQAGALRNWYPVKKEEE